MDGKLRGIQGASSAVSYAGRKFEYENQNRASSQVYGVQKQAYQKRTGLSAPRSLGLRMNCEEPYFPQKGKRLRVYTLHNSKKAVTAD